VCEQYIIDCGCYAGKSYSDKRLQRCTGAMAAAQRDAHQLLRARHAKRVKMRTISRAKRSAAWACSAAGLSFRSDTRMIAPPWHRTTWHDGRSLESHAARAHARHDEQSAPRTFVPHQHHGRMHDGAGTTRVHDSNRLSSSIKGFSTTLPSGRTVSVHLRPY
jgi:hypothetical protein